VFNIAYIDTEICRKAKCPFLDKKTGICSRALVMRKTKEEVCISNVSMRIEKKKNITL